jgi:hypothetical protein
MLATTGVHTSSLHACDRIRCTCVCMRKILGRGGDVGMRYRPQHRNWSPSVDSGVLAAIRLCPEGVS